MPRPKNKSELLAAAVDGYDKLRAAVESFSGARRTATFLFDHRDKNVRDVLVHLFEWQQMMLEWYEIGMAGTKPEMPAAGYTWKTTPDLNASIWAKHQATTLESAVELLDSTHHRLVELVGRHSDVELFTKRRYDWTGTTSLGSYLVSATSSHYHWASKLLRRHSRTDSASNQ